MQISSIMNSINPIGNKLNQVNPTQQPSGQSFEQMLKNAVDDVNDTQVQGYDAMKGIATGEVKNLQKAVQSIEEAELSLKLALEVKNKAINAFKEIGRMQV